MGRLLFFREVVVITARNRRLERAILDALATGTMPFESLQGKVRSTLQAARMATRDLRAALRRLEHDGTVSYALDGLGTITKVWLITTESPHV